MANQYGNIKEPTAEQKALLQRKKAYGDIGEQLDMIYHKGLEAWKLHITQIKEKYPLEK
jgi:hypothetical protein